MRRFFAVVIVSALGGVAFLLSMQVRALGETTNASCVDAQFIWLRGSGQELGEGEEYRAFREKVNERMEWNGVWVRYSFHEIDYPAVALNPVVSIGAKLGAGDAWKYGDSVAEGIQKVQRYIAERVAKCPNERFVLTGYSQGAQVAAESLTGLDRWRVIYVALLGEPKLYLPEGLSVWPMSPKACRGEERSSYRVWVPNCYTYEGILSARRPYVFSNWEGKVGVYCNDHDFICGSSINPLDNDGHLRYASIMSMVASKVVEKVADVFPREEVRDELVALVKKRPTMDTVMLVNSTAMDQEALYEYAWMAAKLTEVTARNGGRVAVVEYKEASSEGFPRIACDFGCSPTEVRRQISNMSIYGKNAMWGQPAMKGGMMLAYEGLEWRTESEKAMVIFNESSDDHASGVTEEDIFAKSLELGNVSIFIATGSGYPSGARRMAEGTGGEGFVNRLDWMRTEFFDRILRHILERPVAKLPLTNYVSGIEERVYFDAGESYGVKSPIVQYDWDIHADRVYERRRWGQIMEWDYHEETEEWVVLKVVAEDGKVGMAIAKVTAKEMPKEPAVKTPSGVKVVRTGVDTARVEWVTESEYVAVGINEVLIGYALGRSGGVNIDDWRPQAKVWLAGVNAEWEFGEKVLVGEGGEDFEDDEKDDDGPSGAVGDEEADDNNLGDVIVDKGTGDDKPSDVIDDEKVVDNKGTETVSKIENESSYINNQIVGRLPEVTLGMQWGNESTRSVAKETKKVQTEEEAAVYDPVTPNVAEVKVEGRKNDEIEVPEAGEIEEQTWEWIVGGSILLISSAGIVYELVGIRRKKML